VARTVDPERHRARRRAILDAAASEFAAHGFAATTTAQICSAAGISTGQLFHYFRSKREVFAAVVTRGEGDETMAGLAAAQEAADPVAALLDVVHLLAADAAVPIVPALVLEAMMQAGRDPDLAEQLEGDSTDEQAAIAGLLTRARTAGLIDAELDVDETAAWIMVMIGAVYLDAATREQADVARQLSMLRLTVERLLRGRGSDRG
jgi:AcrR family transcriptional regulator